MLKATPWGFDQQKSDSAELFRTCNLVHSTNNSWENEKDSEETWEMSQPDIMSGSCLDPDLNKPTIKRLWDTQVLWTLTGYSITLRNQCWFLGNLIIVLWLCYGMNTCTYLCKNVNYVYIKIMINKMKRWKLLKSRLSSKPTLMNEVLVASAKEFWKLPIRLIIILSKEWLH